MSLNVHRRISALAAGVLLLGAMSCRTTPESELQDTQVRPYEGEQGMRPGVGFESIFEDVRGTCVEFDGLESQGEAQEVLYEFDMIENHRELATSIQVSNAQTIKAAVPQSNVNVSAKTKFALGYTYTMNRYSVYIMARVQVRNETTNLKNARLKETLRTALQNNGVAAIDRFRMQCGDQYLAEFTTGGEFIGIIEIETASAEQQAEIKRELEAALAAENFGETSTSSNFVTSLKQITRDKSLKVYTYQRGGAGSEQAGLVDNVDEMIDRARRFPEFVRASSGTAANYTATFKDYFTLDFDFPIEYQNELIAAMDAIQDLAGIQAELIDLRGNIDYILAHPNSFVNVDRAEIERLRSERDKISQKMRAVYEAARTCYRQFRQCQIPEDVAAAPAVKLPERKTTIEQLTRDVLKIRTVLEHINVNALYDAPFNPPDCFIEVRAVAPDGRSKRLRRTPTDFGSPRCQNSLNVEFDIPTVVLDEAFKAIGTTPQEGKIDVGVYDEDPGQDTLIGRLETRYSDITARNALIQPLSGRHITMTVEMELKN